MNVGQVLLEALKNYGARALFGIPGDYILPFFNVIEEQNTLPLYTLSHEPAVGYAADAAARHGKGIGVAVVTYGAGALNLLNAAACAWAEHSPLVVISGAPGREEFNQNLLLHHQIKDAGSQLRIFQEVTCATTVLNDPVSAPHEIARVLDACVEHSRPVYIELPRDVVCAPCLPIERNVVLKEKENETAEAVKIIQERIAASRRPAILADVEIRRFDLEEILLTFARETGIPLVTTLMGKGMFAGDSACLGTYMGQAGDAEIAKLVEESDCLLMLGVIASDTNLGAAARRIDLKNALRLHEGGAIIGERHFANVRLSDALTLLGGKLPEHATPLKRPPNEEKTFLPEKPLSADDIAGAVNAQLAQSPSFMSIPIAVDVGDCLFIGTRICNVPLLASAYYVTMGFGVPAGMGVQAATGERALVITGDGGFQMTGWELLNCARNRLDPIVIVLNNRGWGMLEQFSLNAGYTAFGDISYTKIAEALGGDAYTATSCGELTEALSSAFARRGKFQLIEAVLPKGDISTTLKSFVGALRGSNPRPQ